MVRKSEGLGVNVPEETKAAVGDANDIAQAQFVRFRGRLGTLAHDQELQTEDLLISNVCEDLVSDGKSHGSTGRKFSNKIGVAENDATQARFG